MIKKLIEIERIADIQVGDIVHLNLPDEEELTNKLAHLYPMLIIDIRKHRVGTFSEDYITVFKIVMANGTVVERSSRNLLVYNPLASKKHTPLWLRERRKGER